MEFETQEDRQNYMRTYCSSLQGCENCPHHKILDEKWGVTKNEHYEC